MESLNHSILNLTNYLGGIEFHSFKFWFVRDSRHTFSLYAKDELKHWSKLGVVYETSTGLKLSSAINEEHKATIESEFNRFKSRPEYLVGSLIIVDDNSAYTYDKLLIGCRFVQAFRSILNDVSEVVVEKEPEDYLKPAHAAIEWLHQTDFYTCPASTKYHDNEEHGLLKHTLQVVNNIVKLSSISVFNVNIEDAILVALVHDWCKIGLYESYDRNVKDASGNWVKKKDYKYRDTTLTCFGHGVSSMFLAQKFFNLSVDQALAIRWHMGFCRVADSDMNELQQANEKYPLVHMLQFADQLSIVNYDD